ncbi:MAG: T9SS type A sorting domain-containing protein [Bacteroidetes bacterium]|nr:MAG: T9SS type A sorting domain-containing protein [Bacteroidota bacterium]
MGCPRMKLIRYFRTPEGSFGSAQIEAFHDLTDIDEMKSSIAMQVLDAQGREILKMNKVGSFSNIDLFRFRQGIYFLKISDGKTSQVKKIIYQ